MRIPSHCAMWRGLMAVVLLSIAGLVQALTVGQPEVLSFLGEPLDIVVPVDVNSGSPVVAIGSEALHQKMGLEPLRIRGLSARLEGWYVRVTSEERVFEPLVPLVISVHGDGQRVVRDLSLLLEVPSATLSEARARHVQRLQQLNRTAETRERPRQAPTQQIEPSDSARSGEALYGPVQPGETLSGIAAQFVRGVDQQAQFVSRLRELNRGQLGDNDWPQVGMMLRLPAAADTAGGTAAASQGGQDGQGGQGGRGQAASWTMFDVRGDAAAPTFRLAVGDSVDWAAVAATGPAQRSLLQRAGETFEGVMASDTAEAVGAAVDRSMDAGLAAAGAAGARLSELANTVVNFVAPTIEPVDRQRRRSIDHIDSDALVTYETDRVFGLSLPTLAVLLGVFIAVPLFAARWRKQTRPESTAGVADAVGVARGTWGSIGADNRRDQGRDYGNDASLYRHRDAESAVREDLQRRIYELMGDADEIQRGELMLAEAHVEFGQLRTAEAITASVARQMGAH